jgi:hypothetical protein
MPCSSEITKITKPSPPGTVVATMLCNAVGPVHSSAAMSVTVATTWTAGAPPTVRFRGPLKDTVGTWPSSEV